MCSFYHFVGTLLILGWTATITEGWTLLHPNHLVGSTSLCAHPSTRREWIIVATSTMTTASSLLLRADTAHAVGPVKIALTPLRYNAVICPPDKPIPGEKAMIGMRSLCVTVLANNPDGGTDAGQFAMIESVSEKDSKVQFEFISAVPRDKDLSQYANGIGPLDFTSLRIISYPGGQQFGAISPCEMNEFSDECEAWEAEIGPYEKAAFMVKSNPRTKGY